MVHVKFMKVLYCEPMEPIAHLSPECDGSGLCSSTRRRMLSAFQLWDASLQNATHATVMQSHVQEQLHATFDEVGAALGLRNFLRLMRDANELSTSLTCSRVPSRCNLVKKRAALNENLRLNMHVFGRHIAEGLFAAVPTLKMSRAALVREFSGHADLVQAVHGSVWTFTIKLLEERMKLGKLIWRNDSTAQNPEQASTSGSAIKLTAGAASIISNITQDVCGQLNPLKAFHCVHGMGHAGSYVALLVMEQEQDSHTDDTSRSVWQLPQAMTRGNTVCAAASEAISKLPIFERSRAMFEWGCSAGVWMVTYQHQAPATSMVYDAMLRWKSQDASLAVATQPLASSPSPALQRAAQRAGPCALEPMQNYPQYCFAWWFSPSLPDATHSMPRTPPDLNPGDCILVGLAATPSHGAACAFAMANRYAPRAGPAAAGRTSSKDPSLHLLHCKEYLGWQPEGVSALKLKRRLWLACLAGTTMRSVEAPSAL